MYLVRWRYPSKTKIIAQECTWWGEGIDPKHFVSLLYISVAIKASLWILACSIYTNILSPKRSCLCTASCRSPFAFLCVTKSPFRPFYCFSQSFALAVAAKPPEVYPFNMLNSADGINLSSTINPWFKPQGLIYFMVHNHPGSNRDLVQT